jgi:glycosyltransferase involved in cell wall biosynthesis
VVADYHLLTVIVPVFNERNTVSEILRRMRLVDLPLDKEIIVVDDGSTDGTDKVLAAVEDSTVRMLRHPTNQGKGAAIRTGLAAARGDLVLIQDADLEYDPNDWPRLLAPLLAGTSEVVYGTRFSRTETDTLRRRAGDLGLSVLTAMLFQAKVSDIETCYKLIDRKVLDGLDLKADRFDVEPEVTAKLLKGKHHIVEVPISYRRRRLGEGRKFAWNDALHAGWTLVRLRFGRG